MAGNPGNYNNQAKYVSRVSTAISSGEKIDIFAGYSMTGATLAVNGYLDDLADKEYIDLSAPWWPDSLISQAMIKDKLYFASGDISTNLLYVMYTVFFNKQMTVDHSLDDPYALVDSGSWTYTKMIEMATGLYSDKDGSETATADDRFGFCSTDINFDSFFTGAGLKTVERNEKGNLSLSPSFNSDKTVSLIENLTKFIWESGDVYYGATYKVFMLNNTLFTVDRTSMALNLSDSYNLQYGFLPLPKYDSEQEKYTTFVASAYTMYSISVNSKQPEAAGAVLECFGSESYRGVTPILFEVTMKYKYAKDSDSARMFDIIRNGVSIDPGRIFATELKNLSFTLFRNAVIKNNAAGWTPTFKANSTVFEKLLNNINSAFEKSRS